MIILSFLNAINLAQLIMNVNSRLLFKVKRYIYYEMHRVAKASILSKLHLEEKGRSVLCLLLNIQAHLINI